MVGHFTTLQSTLVGRSESVPFRHGHQSAFSGNVRCIISREYEPHISQCFYFESRKNLLGRNRSREFLSGTYALSLRGPTWKCMGLAVLTGCAICRWCERTCMAAAENGHLHVLQWCREMGCPWGAETCVGAAMNGHLNVVQWCHENECPWDSRTCAFAAANGHLHVLQWCRENGCPWNEQTTGWAAAEGRFDVVQWCHNHGCPWDTWTCSNAARNGHLHIYYNGLEPMVVRGIDGRASKPHNRDTGTLYSGLKKMAVHHHHHRNEDDVFSNAVRNA